MRRILAGAFVATTTTAVVGCAPEPVERGNPPRPRPTTQAPTATVAPTTTATSATPAPKPEGQANPVDAEGRTIHLGYNDDSCFVYLPFPPLKPGEMRPPGSAPPSQKTECPAEMKKPAYKSCRGGVITYKAGDSCECFEPGNPPRVQPTDCP